METIQVIYNTFGPPIGILIGFLIQFYLSKKSEDRKLFREIELESYSDYIKALVESAFISSQEQRIECLRKAANAKVKISIYGSSEVIAAIAEFDSIGADTSSECGRAKVLSIIKSMRKGIGPEAKLDDLSIILLGNDNHI